MKRKNRDTQRLKDQIYSDYQKETNMSFSELIKWKNNPLSKKASLSTKPINLALRLKKKNKSKWKLRDYKGAIKAISYLKRAKKIRGKNYIKGKITKNEIALKNWGYNKKKERNKKKR